jgi:hypothetical protein
MARHPKCRTINGVRYVALEATTPKVNTFYENVIKARVPCAYGSKSCAKRTFAPNGVGSFQHRTCAPGLVAMKAAQA